MKIKVLSEETINKIAAGEIIERPASIVKELVENSLDAGASQIDVEVKAGGKNLIRVTDNGCGMSKDDAVLAFERHATSKIDTADDLTSIATLGFRGEALPSIASVSKLLLVTKPEEMDSAVSLKIEGGKFLENKDTGAPYGTMVCVQNLFYNTPARRKFLKTNTTELTHIINVISNYALIYSNCGFTLTHNDESIIEIFKKDSLLDRIRILYGNETAEGVVKIDFEKAGIRLTGFSGIPQNTRQNRSRQFLFVNKRPILNKSVNYIINEVYSTLIPRGRFPVIFLFLEVQPDSIDINVHPTKREVRFGDDRLIREIIREGIAKALGVKQTAPSGSFTNSFIYNIDNKVSEPWHKEEFDTAFPGIDGHKVLQIHNSYIIYETEDGFSVMDQHAVHERILYENIKSKKSPECQKLLIPINIELNACEEETLKSEAGFLNELGFNIEEFGNRTVIIDMIPAVADKVDIPSFIKDMLNETSGKQKAVFQNDLKDGIIKFIACRSAVKQGDSLNPLEMHKLIRDWHDLKLPYTCPHGRPAVFKLTREELDRKFRRS